MSDFDDWLDSIEGEPEPWEPPTPDDDDAPQENERDSADQSEIPF